MITPTGRREALEVLTRRGLSQRKACRYLGLSRRVATYTLKQPEKDRSLGERLMAAAQEVPRFDVGLAGVERIARAANVASPSAQHSAPTSSPTSLRRRHTPARRHTAQFGLEL